MHFPQKQFEEQECPLRPTVIEKREAAQGKVENVGGVERLIMEGAVWKKGKAQGDYQYSLEGVKTVRLLSKKEPVNILDKESSRETTHRSNLQSFPQTEKPKIELAFERLLHFIVHQRLRPSWNRIQLICSIKSAGSQRKYRKEDWLLKKSADVLYFPLLCSKLDDIKLCFFSKLQLQTRCPARPYELTILFLLVRLQARLRYTNLQKAIRALKE